MSNVRTAVILAAGMGTRLKKIGSEAPKGFLTLGEQPIIRESLECLFRAGIERVVIVTGHLYRFYEKLAADYDGRVETVHNDKYADSGSMYSLAQVRGRVNEPFLLLESDLIYESRSIDELLSYPQSDVMLASGFTGSGDEVWTWTGENGTLLELSKDRNGRVEDPAGELVGITRLSPEFFSIMLEESGRVFETTLKMEYEQCMVLASRRRPLKVHVVSDLSWAEIDDESHLERARKQIYPKIKTE